MSRTSMLNLYAATRTRTSRERRSVLITSNLVFSQWDKIFKEAMTTAAAIDRLVLHSITLELTGESFLPD